MNATLRRYLNNILLVTLKITDPMIVITMLIALVILPAFSQYLEAFCPVASQSVFPDCYEAIDILSDTGRTIGMYGLVACAVTLILYKVLRKEFPRTIARSIVSLRYAILTVLICYLVVKYLSPVLVNWQYEATLRYIADQSLLLAGTSDLALAGLSILISISFMPIVTVLIALLISVILLPIFRTDQNYEYENV